MTQCCMGQDGLRVRLYMMHPNNNLYLYNIIYIYIIYNNNIIIDIDIIIWPFCIL